MSTAAEKPSCKTCVRFGQTYKHDIETEAYAYQQGTCNAPTWVRVGGPAVPIWQSSVCVDRDDVRPCHSTQLPLIAPRGFF